MRISFTLFGAVASMLVTSCTPPQPPAEPKATPQSTAVVTPTATPSPSPTAARFAPEGTYFVLQRISITADSGNIGIPAGTQVRLVRKEGDSLRVTDGVHEFSVPQKQLTSDLDVAAGVLAAGVKQSDAQDLQAEPAQPKQPQPPAVQTPRKKDTPQPSPAATVSKTPARNQSLQARYAELEREEISVNAQLAYAEKARKDADYEKWRYRVHTGKTVPPGQVNAIKARLKQIQQEKRQIQLQLTNTPQR